MRDLYIETLQGLKAECKLNPNYDDSMIQESLDFAIKAIGNQQSSLQVLSDVFDTLKKIHNSESEIIEKIPEDMNFHLAVRRGLILAQQAVQEKIDEIKGEKE